MKNIKIYASGSEKNAPSGFTSWRDELKTECEWYEQIKIIDPVSHFDYDNVCSETTKQCYNYFMWLIDKCDVVLVNLDHSYNSVGTGYEIQHASDCRKPIIGFGVNPETWYEWTADRCDVIFDTIQLAVEYIQEYYVDM